MTQSQSQERDELFRIDRNSIQYDIRQPVEDENEQLAQQLLIDRAKADKMNEWCFLPKLTVQHSGNLKYYFVFRLIANK